MRATKWFVGGRAIMLLIPSRLEGARYTSAVMEVKTLFRRIIGGYDDTSRVLNERHTDITRWQAQGKEEYLVFQHVIVEILDLCTATAATAVCLPPH